MAIIAQLAAKLSADTTNFRKGMQSSRKELGAFQKSIGSLKTTIATAIGGYLGIQGVKSIISLASAAEESGSKFNAVFKDQSEAARSFGDNLAKAVGRSKYDMREFLATMQDTFVPLGFARDQARELSQQIVKLGVDLASFNNKADDEALRDLQSAIVGNHETMRKYGVIITESTLNTELLSMGFKKATAGATEQQKAVARLNIMMRSTTDAQGDAARTAGSFANQVRSLKAGIKDLGTDLGSIFLPVANQVVGGIKYMVDAFREFGQDLRVGLQQIMSWLPTFSGEWKSTFSEIGDVVLHFRSAWKAAFLDLAEATTTNLQKIVRASQQAALSLKGDWEKTKTSWRIITGTERPGDIESMLPGAAPKFKRTPWPDWGKRYQDWTRGTLLDPDIWRQLTIELGNKLNALGRKPAVLPEFDIKGIIAGLGAGNLGAALAGGGRLAGGRAPRAYDPFAGNEPLVRGFLERIPGTGNQVTTLLDRANKQAEKQGERHERLLKRLVQLAERQDKEVVFELGG